MSNPEDATDFYKTLMESTNAIPWKLDWATKEFTYVGPQIEELLGWKPHTWKSVVDWADRIHEEDRERIVSLCVAQSENGVDHEADYRALKKDGGFIWVRDVVHVIRTNGATESLIGFILDISERKKIEDELLAARNSAEAANQAKSQFLATMSHEIRTPMNGVLGMADVLAQTQLSDQQRDFVETIRESGKTLLNLLNDILDLSKIEAGHIELELTDFSLAKLLYATSALWELAAEGKGLLFSVQNNVNDADTFRGDHTCLRQILNNLIGNAIKFTHHGRIDVVVDARPLDDGRIDLRVEVRDTGIGISVDQKETLFEPFTQADSSTTRHYGGTGLGLTISKSLVDLMDGEIGLESTPGEGSVFWFTVPAELVNPAKAERDQTLDTRISSDYVTDERPLRILIAEDNKIGQPVPIETADAPISQKVNDEIDEISDELDNLLNVKEQKNES